MQKIIPHIWYDTQAKEAAEFYTSFFKNSKITNIATIPGTPSGDTEIVSFTLSGQDFMAISAGPLFKPNPSISFMVACASKDEVDHYWEKLSDGGRVLMELGSYPFSERYGWIEDKFGVSWQLATFGETAPPQVITPTLLFVGDVCGKAEEAINFYASVFKNSSVGEITRYGEDAAPDKPGTVMYADLVLEGQNFAAMDSAREHGYTFNEAISFLVYCETQEEIDYYWEKLSAVAESEQCGWLKDKFGVSWQISPRIMDEMMMTSDKAQLERVTKAFLQMKKFDLAELKKAYDGK